MTKAICIYNGVSAETLMIDKIYFVEEEISDKYMYAIYDDGKFLGYFDKIYFKILSELREERIRYILNMITWKRGLTSDDYDIWYEPCKKCGYDTGKSTKPKDGNKTCWKCGNHVQRDYSDRALKIQTS